MSPPGIQEKNSGRALHAILRFLDAHPIVMAFCVAALTCIVAIVTMEIVCFRLVRIRDRAAAVDFRYEPNPFTHGGAFGQLLKQNFQTHCCKSVNGRSVWNVTYSTDERGRRTTTGDDLERRRRFAVFFGCSFTFGEGVEDQDTLPSQFASAAPEYRAYNYGEPGYGPQHMLMRLQRDELRNEIHEHDGIAVYTFIDDHVRRAIGGMRAFIGWARAYPCYDYVDEVLTYRGNFDEARPILTRLYVHLSRSSILECINADLPLWISEKDLQLTSDIIVESERLFKNRFQESEFLVVLYPVASRSYGPQVMAYLKEKGIRVMDYENLLTGTDPTMFQFTDGHPNARSYNVVSKTLASDLDAWK